MTSPPVAFALAVFAAGEKLQRRARYRFSVRTYALTTS